MKGRVMKKLLSGILTLTSRFCGQRHFAVDQITLIFKGAFCAFDSSRGKAKTRSAFCTSGFAGGGLDVACKMRATSSRPSTLAAARPMYQQGEKVPLFLYPLGSRF